MAVALGATDGDEQRSWLHTPAVVRDVARGRGKAASPIPKQLC